MTNAPSPRVDRETIARVIDPEFWGAMPETTPVYEGRKLVGGRLKKPMMTLAEFEAHPSLVKADAILLALGVLHPSREEEQYSALSQSVLAPRSAPSETWRTMYEVPAVGRKIVAVYLDGSGAQLFYVAEHGLIDSEGEECATLAEADNFGPWAYLPDRLSLWCEIRSDEPLTFPAESGADAGGAWGRHTGQNETNPISPPLSAIAEALEEAYDTLVFLNAVRPEVMAPETARAYYEGLTEECRAIWDAAEFATWGRAWASIGDKCVEPMAACASALTALRAIPAPSQPNGWRDDGGWLPLVLCPTDGVWRLHRLPDGREVVASFQGQDLGPKVRRWRVKTFGYHNPARRTGEIGMGGVERYTAPYDTFVIQDLPEGVYPTHFRPNDTVFGEPQPLPPPSGQESEG